MADQQVDKFIAELSGILERNRQQRASTESELAKGDAQAVAAGEDATAPLNASSGFAAGLKGGMGSKKPEAKVPDARETELLATNPYDSADKSKPYGYSGNDGPPAWPASARALSPSTTAAGRVGLAQNFARTQDLLSENPYRLEENAAPGASPDPAVLEEQKKRFTQNLMNQRGETGGPLGGAGQRPYGYSGNDGPPAWPASARALSPSTTAAGRAGGTQAPPLNTPTAAGMDPGLIAAVSGSGGPVGQMDASAAVPVYPTPQQPDLALLEAYQQYQRQRGGL